MITDECHPIEKLIYDLFPKKSISMRSSWANYFIQDCSFSEISQIETASSQLWKEFQNNLPQCVIKELKIHFFSKAPQWEEVLSENDISNILKFLNLQLGERQIVSFFGVQKNSPKGELILEKIKILKKPPKPYPNCKRIQHKDKTQKLLPVFHYVGQEDPFRKYYTFVTVGQTGSGKTTLLDALTNKCLGQQITDNWRWKLVDESQFYHVKDSKSKTQNISVYYINDCQNKFNIRIIDTPGFGDTDGIQKDDKITSQFQQLFAEISEIDYILLTVKSSETKLKTSSKYIYDRVLQLFGKDAKDRFLLMCTFSDDKKPLCLKALEGIHYQKYFTFNNSALLTSPQQQNSTTKFFWQMGIASIQNFQQYVTQNDKLPLSLRQSKEVLQTRKYLNASISTSRKCLLQAWQELGKAQTNLTSIIQNQQKIAQNGSYTRSEPRERIERKILDNYYQLCQNCQVTCCQVCKWPQGQKESKCSYFNNGNSCPLCPGKCSKKAHLRTNQQIVKIKYQQIVIIDLKKKMLDEGINGLQLFSKLLQQSLERIDHLNSQIWKHSISIKQDLKKLQQKALKPKLWTDRDFYQQMKTQEQNQRKSGWQQRVKFLENILHQIDALENIKKSVVKQDLTPGLKSLKEKCKKIEEKYQGKKDKCIIY